MNLLVALDALLEEESVTGAAERLRTSAPAMSRTLGRIRRVLNDPVLVRAGRNLVPTPLALELRHEVHELVRQANSLLTRAADTDPATFTRRFGIQTGDLLLAAFAPALIATMSREAPGVTLRFLSETVEGTPALREGRVDLEVGVIEHTDPETRVERIGVTHFRAAVRVGHRLAKKRVTAREFAKADHVSVSRRGRTHGPIDDRLAELGLRRRVLAVVPGQSAALDLVRETDLVCLVPAPLEPARLHTFAVPVELPPLTISMAWHPRNDGDPAHRWLRTNVREVLSGML